MKEVRIIQGTYGYKAPGSLYIDPKGPGETCIETDEKAQRLVELGVGVIIANKGFATPVQPTEQPGAIIVAPENETAVKGVDALTKAELREVADSLGLSLRVKATKEELVAAIKEAEPLPDLTAEDPVV